METKDLTRPMKIWRISVWKIKYSIQSGRLEWTRLRTSTNNLLVTKDQAGNWSKRMRCMEILRARLTPTGLYWSRWSKTRTWLRSLRAWTACFRLWNMLKTSSLSLSLATHTFSTRSNTTSQILETFLKRFYLSCSRKKKILSLRFWKDSKVRTQKSFSFAWIWWTVRS